jgi:hypothetical protein
MSEKFTVCLTIKVRPEEKKEIEAFSKTQNLGISSFCRYAIFRVINDSEAERGGKKRDD